MVTMHMPLLNSEPEAWRSVEVTPLGVAEYRVEGFMPAIEDWQFPPGTVVQCRWKRFSDGQHRLVPTGNVDNTMRETFERMAGGSIPILVAGAAMSAFLPRASEGYLEPLSLFLTGLAFVSAALFIMLQLKPRSAFSKSALRLTLAVGLGVCLLSPLAGF